MNLPANIDAARLPGGCVYFIGDQRRVKIGHTTDLVSRLKDLRVASPDNHSVLRVLPGGSRTERWLHKRFSDRHIRGEWFRFTDEMMEITPPDEVPTRPVELRRRDVRLSLRERIRDADARADNLNLTERERIMLIIQSLRDDELAPVLSYVRARQAKVAAE